VGNSGPMARLVGVVPSSIHLRLPQFKDKKT